MAVAPTNIEDQGDPNELLTPEEYVTGIARAVLYQNNSDGGRDYQRLTARRVGIDSDVGFNLKDCR